MGKQSTNNNPPVKKSLIHRIKTEAATAAEDATEYMYGFSYRRNYNYTVHTYSTVRFQNKCAKYSTMYTVYVRV